MSKLCLLFSISFSVVLCSDFEVEQSDYRQFYDLYKDLDRHQEPIFVSVDCILHTFHLLYDYSLRDIEINYLATKLDTLLSLMIVEAKRFNSNNDDIAIPTLAYFSVAKKLLNPDYDVDNSVSDVVDRELALIGGHRGFSVSAVLSIEEDYSQYVVRGHYRRSEISQRYFLAMLYLGRMGFYVKPRKEELSEPHMIQALIVVQMLEGDAQRLWDDIYEVTNLYVGGSDDLGPVDFKKLLRDSFPSIKPIDVINNKKQLAKFIEYASGIGRPKIIATFTRDDEDAYLASLSFKFIGQRFIPDAYIFQNLVYNKVGNRANPRLFPRGLDVLAVLGSKRAEHYLLNLYDDDRFYNYERQLYLLRDEFGGLGPDQWAENLYWGWLAVIRDLITVPSSVPELFRNSGWIDKNMVTALAFWSELRHDAILYAKQSYTVSIVSIKDPTLRKAYIEPRSDIYRRLKTLLLMIPTKKLSVPIEERVTGFRKFLDRCIAISDTELEEAKITKQDELFLYDIGPKLEYFSLIPEDETGSLQADKSVELIADVHTDINTGRILETGVGKIDLVKIKLGKSKYIGGVFSYYEFMQPMSDRLADEKWQKMDKPERPAWQKYYRSVR